jgi:hypothetical protein
VAEVAQQPPEPRGAALGRLVVCDHQRVGADARPARRCLEVLRLRQRVAAALAGRGCEIAVQVH